MERKKRKPSRAICYLDSLLASQQVNVGRSSSPVTSKGRAETELYPMLCLASKTGTLFYHVQMLAFLPSLSSPPVAAGAAAPSAEAVAPLEVDGTLTSSS